MMVKQYVEQRDQGYWITDSRVSLDSVVLAFLDGLSPETIVAECFPVRNRSGIKALMFLKKESI